MACAAPLDGMAQSYPDKPIKVYQGFAAGGNADTIARVVGAEMTKGLAQPFVVEAQAGAGGTIAAATVARGDRRSTTTVCAILSCTACRFASHATCTKPMPPVAMPAT